MSSLTSVSRHRRARPQRARRPVTPKAVSFHAKKSEMNYLHISQHLQGRGYRSKVRGKKGKVRGKEGVANHLSTQRAAATRPLRAEVKLVTGAQLSEAGSYTPPPC